MNKPVYDNTFTRAKALGVGRTVMRRLIANHALEAGAQTSQGHPLFLASPDAIARDADIIRQYRDANFLAKNHYLLSK
jgi:hypothetical protein